MKNKISIGNIVTGLFVIFILGLMFYIGGISIIAPIALLLIKFGIGPFFNSYIAQYIITGLLLLLLLSIPSFIKTAIKIKKHNAKCEHGIRGGFYKLNCDECQKLINERILIQQRQKEYDDKLSIIKIKANEFRLIELQRLRKQYLFSLDNIMCITPRQFEVETVKIFNNLGFDAKVTPQVNDGGKDGIAYKNGKKYLIECKRFQLSNKVGRPMLQKFFAAMHEEKAYKGFFVTTSDFSAPACEYARKNRIELVNGHRLIKMIHMAYPSNNPNDGLKAKVMCLECEDIVIFDLLSDKHDKYCINKHNTTININLSDLKK